MVRRYPGTPSRRGILKTSSSPGVSGCTSNLFSHRAVNDLDVSKPAGSESEWFVRGCQLDATMRGGTIANSPDLNWEDYYTSSLRKNPAALTQDVVDRVQGKPNGSCEQRMDRAWDHRGAWQK